MIELFTIGFCRPDLLREQKRLLDKYLGDQFGFCLIDNSPKDADAASMEMMCREVGAGYLRAVTKKHEHPEALNFAALHVTRTQARFFGFLDHDIFPRRPTTLIDKLEKNGFVGVGQRHSPTGKQYLWPGFCFFSSDWLNGRSLDFGGIRGDYKRDDGDCGSMNWPLFSDADWEAMYSLEHGYQMIREPDGYGLQSSGVEMIGDWLHLTNASHWMEVPDSDDRDEILMKMVAAL